MRRKKVFTLAEVSEYIRTGRSFQFIAKDDNEVLRVAIDSQLQFAQFASDDDENTEGLQIGVLIGIDRPASLNPINPTSFAKTPTKFIKPATATTEIKIESKTFLMLIFVLIPHSPLQSILFLLL